MTVRCGDAAGAGGGDCIDGLTYREAPVNGSPPENEVPEDGAPLPGATYREAPV